MVLHNQLNILVCPVCKGHLIPDNGISTLRCLACGLAFPVKEGIPVMMVDAAEKIEPQEPDAQTASMEAHHDSHKVKD
ncbi:MAG: Trm112 family protein [Desulfuromonadales bacterium]|nr:Trm112 family protein [Desulfuromonadales bacterium]